MVLYLAVKSDLKNAVLLPIHSMKRLSYHVYFIYGFICSCPLIVHSFMLLLGCNFMVMLVHLVLGLSLILLQNLNICFGLTTAYHWIASSTIPFISKQHLNHFFLGFPPLCWKRMGLNSDEELMWWEWTTFLSAFRVAFCSGTWISMSAVLGGNNKNDDMRSYLRSTKMALALAMDQRRLNQDE